MIICATGAAGSGKDELARIGSEEFGTIRAAFADSLKEEVAEFLTAYEVEFEPRHLWGTQEDKEETLLFQCLVDLVIPSFIISYLEEYAVWSTGYYCFTPRTLLQWWGTEYRRNQDPDYWVKRAMEKCSDSNKNYILSDGRFLNEVSMVKASEGKTIKIIRPSGKLVQNSSHQSENSLNDYGEWDYVILNDGSLEEYQEKIRRVLKEIFLVNQFKLIYYNYN